MYRTKVLILTSDIALESEIHQLLLEHPDKYTIFHQTELAQKTDLFDVTLIDENLIDKNPADFLAQYTIELFPSTVIYLTDSIELNDEFTAVKSLTADYLYKSQLTASGLNNSIKYALESRKLKREIEKQQKRYQSLFYNAVDAAFFLTADLKIENINEVFSNLFGVKLHQINGDDFKTIFNDPTEYERFVSRFIEDDKESYECEMKFNRLDRKGIFPGHLKISALREYYSSSATPSKMISGYHGTLSNISYKKRISSIKENSSRIAMTYRLARTLAHEIRNPLTNITLAVNQLEDEVPKNEETELYIGIIERCTRRIDKLIDQLLKSSEQKSLQSTECDIIDITNRAVDDAKDRAQLLDIKLMTDFESEKSLYFCDSGKLLIAISNIITNAIESIDNESGQVIIGTYEEDGYLCIYIEDNGSGMTESQQKTLFDPFFTSKKKGVGLGLTNTLSIISEHKGHIEVDSEKSIGSTFTILLPIANILQKD